MRLPLFLLLILMGPALAIPGPAPIPVPVVKSSAPHKEILVLNRERPGAKVNIEDGLVEGKTNIVVFFADW